MVEYAFDVKLFAVVRVCAPSLDQAQAHVRRNLDCLNVGAKFRDGQARGEITEVSMDKDHPLIPFEVDGVEL